MVPGAPAGVIVEQIVIIQRMVPNVVKHPVPAMAKLEPIIAMITGTQLHHRVRVGASVTLVGQVIGVIKKQMGSLRALHKSVQIAHGLTLYFASKGERVSGEGASTSIMPTWLPKEEIVQNGATPVVAQNHARWGVPPVVFARVKCRVQILGVVMNY